MSKIMSNKIHRISRRSWHDALVEYFNLIKKMEDIIDSIRLSLCSLENFNEKNLFDFIDKKGKNNITLNDLILFLKGCQINFNEENLRKFIHNFDKDNDFCLNFNEFKGVILPRKYKLLQKNVENSAQNNGNYYIIDENIRKSFCNILIKEMELVDGCNKIIKEIQGGNGFTPYEAFLDIVNDDEGYINENNLAYFLIKNNIEIQKEDAHQLMFRLDKDNDGKISYDEFQDMLLPLNKSTINQINNIDNNLNINGNSNDNDNGNKLSNENNINNFINLNKDNKLNNYNNLNNDKINQIMNYNMNNHQQKEIKYISNSQQKNNINNKYNLYLGEDISSIGNKDDITNKQIKKDIKIENNNKDIKINLAENYITNSNMFYDSLECSKNQENPINKNSYKTSFKKNISIKNNNNNGIKKSNKKYCHNYFRNNTKNDMTKNVEERLKKVFQIPKEEEKLYTPIEKNEENKEIIQNSKSPMRPYTKIPLYYDYSNQTNANEDNQNKKSLIRKHSVPKRNNSMKIFATNLELNSQEKIFNNNDMNNQIYNTIHTNSNEKEDSNMRHYKKCKKKIQIPQTSRNEDKENTLYIYNAYHTYRENSNYYNSSNKSNNNTSYSSNHNIANNYIENNYTNCQDKKINNDNNNNQKELSNNNINDNNNDISSQNITTNNNYNNKIQKDIQDLIINSPFRLKTNDNAINNIENKLFSSISPIKKKNVNVNEPGNLNSFSENKIKKVKEFNKKEQDIINMNRNFVTEIKNSENNEINNYGSAFLTDNKTRPFFEKNKNNNNLNNYNSLINTNNNRVNLWEMNNKLNRINCKHFSLDKKNININNQQNIKENNIKFNMINQYVNGKSNELKNNEANSIDFNSFESPNPFKNLNLNIEKRKEDMVYNSKNLKFEQTQYDRINNLYNLLYDILKWELIIENLRLSLSSQQDVNSKILFQIFDTKKRNLISLKDITKSLKKLGMNISCEDGRYIFLKSNKRLKEKYDFNQFCEIFLPNNEEKRKEINERILNEKCAEELSNETKNIIILLFQKIIEGEKSNEIYRNNLAMVPNSSGFDLFNLMKKNYSVGVYREDIDKFLCSRGKIFNNNEIDTLMRRLDKNKDGVIDYTEFLTEITPKFIF